MSCKVVNGDRKAAFIVRYNRPFVKKVIVLTEFISTLNCLWLRIWEIFVAQNLLSQQGESNTILKVFVQLLLFIPEVSSWTCAVFFDIAVSSTSTTSFYSNNPFGIICYDLDLLNLFSSVTCSNPLTDVWVKVPLEWLFNFR